MREARNRLFNTYELKALKLQKKRKMRMEILSQSYYLEKKEWKNIKARPSVCP